MRGFGPRLSGGRSILLSFRFKGERRGDGLCELLFVANVHKLLNREREKELMMGCKLFIVMRF